MSPFSQTVDSRSWSTFYSEEMSFGTSFEPLVPQLCLHHLWTEAEQLVLTPSLSLLLCCHVVSTAICRPPSEAHHNVSSFFLTQDLVGCSYVCALLPSLAQLWMFEYDDNDDICKDTPPLLGHVTVLESVAAVPLQTLKLLMVLRPGSTALTIYSGVMKVGGMVTLVVGII